MTEQSQSDGAERRRHARQLVCIPVYLKPLVVRSDLALIRNISQSGAFVLTRAALELGETIYLTLQLTDRPGGPTYETQADVVRVEELEHERTQRWLYGVGVRFRSLLTHLDPAEISRLIR